MTKPRRTKPRPAPSPQAIVATVSLLSAMAHPVRLQVLLALARLGPQAVGALQTLVGIEQSALSHQLRTLRDAGLVEREVRGHQRVYHLHDHHVAHVVEDALAHAIEIGD